MSTTPPGWYQDGRGDMRWWDGTEWTDRVQPAESAQMPAGSPEGAPKKSRPWILWTVLGAVAVILVVLAAVLIPLAIGAGSAEDRAVAAVERYDDAWAEADCEAYQQSTTLEYRESLGITACETFAAEAAGFDENTDEYELEIAGVDQIDERVIEVVTVETYLSRYDEQGQELAEPERVRDELRYVVVLQGDRWLIDGLDYNE